MITTLAEFKAVNENHYTSDILYDIRKGDVIPGGHIGDYLTLNQCIVDFDEDGNLEFNRLTEHMQRKENFIIKKEDLSDFVNWIKKLNYIK